jgi:hypothetical protein
MPIRHERVIVSGGAGGTRDPVAMSSGTERLQSSSDIATDRSELTDRGAHTHTHTHTHSGTHKHIYTVHSHIDRTVV